MNPSLFTVVLVWEIDHHLVALDFLDLPLSSRVSVLHFVARPKLTTIPTILSGHSLWLNKVAVELRNTSA